MKPRKSNEIASALQKKGFEKLSSKKKSHHVFFYFMHEGKKTSIKTFLSHGKGETYGAYLMQKIKRQLHFLTSEDAENFFDCPLTKEKYAQILIDQKLI